MERRPLWLVLGMTLILTACDGNIKEGINRYYGGEFAKAKNLLQGFAKKDAAQSPSYQISTDATHPVESLLPALTKFRFEAWHAYAGSLFGLAETDAQYKEACLQTQNGLREIRVDIKGGVSQKFDPKTGDFWPAPVFTMRTWWIQFKCADFFQ